MAHARGLALDGAALRRAEALLRARVPFAREHSREEVARIQGCARGEQRAPGQHGRVMCVDLRRQRLSLARREGCSSSAARTVVGARRAVRPQRSKYRSKCVTAFAERTNTAAQCHFGSSSARLLSLTRTDCSKPSATARREMNMTSRVGQPPYMPRAQAQRPLAEAAQQPSPRSGSAHHSGTFLRGCLAPSWAHRSQPAPARRRRQGATAGPTPTPVDLHNNNTSSKLSG